MKFSDLLAYRGMIVSDPEDGLYRAAEVCIRDNKFKWVLSRENAVSFWRQFVRLLLNSGKYASVGQFLWGASKFTLEPRSVRLIWDEIPKTNKMLVMGAGRQGKSFTFGAWCYLDWIRDPFYTSVKIISVNKAHGASNLFAHIVSLHSESIIPMEGEALSSFIQIEENNKRATISLVSIPKQGSGKGPIRGLPPWPRKTPHPIFGSLARQRLIIDEAEFAPEGIWEDIDNMLLPAYNKDIIKVFAATNPMDSTSAFADRACPPEGWEAALDFEHDQWVSKMGWNVTRLDASKSENVVHGKVIFPGFQTREGYNQIISSKGKESAVYWSQCRGMYPPSNLITTTIISRESFDDALGELLFSGKTVFCAGVDLALEGGDKVSMSVGKFGKSYGWIDRNNVEHKFEKERYAIQLVKQINIRNGDTLDVAQHIVDACNKLDIESKWLIVDRTGNGAGVHDVLKRTFGSDVMGINYSEGATDRKILEDEADVASDKYYLVCTEIMYSVKKFLEFNYLKISPNVTEIEKLRNQLISRLARPRGLFTALEPKSNYKAREGESPDQGDSLGLLVHLIRIRSEFAAFMIENSKAGYQEENYVSPTDKLDFVDFMT